MIKTTKRFSSEIRKNQLARIRQQELVTELDALRWRDMTPRQKVVYGTKQTSYAGVVALGIGLTATIGYLVIKELVGNPFDSTPTYSKLYGKSLERLQKSETATAMLGQPVRGYVEHSRRRAQKIKWDGQTAFVQYDVAGSIAQGTVRVWQSSGGSGDQMRVILESPGQGLPSKVVEL